MKLNFISSEPHTNRRAFEIGTDIELNRFHLIEYINSIKISLLLLFFTLLSFFCCVVSVSKQNREEEKKN